MISAGAFVGAGLETAILESSRDERSQWNAAPMKTTLTTIKRKIHREGFMLRTID